MEILFCLFVVVYICNLLPIEATAKTFINVLCLVLVLIFAFGPPFVGHPFWSYPVR